MKKVIRLLTVVAAAGIVAAVPSSVFATCPSAQFLQHSLGMFFSGCPDATPVAGYAYVVGSDATLNTFGASLACNDASVMTNQFIPCQPEAGIPGDGNVTIQYDWGGASNTPTGTNCPNPSGVAGVGRNVLQVVANDGSSVLLTIGFQTDFATYVVESAHPGAGFSPIACSNDNGLNIQSHTSGLNADTFCINQTAPHFWSDCDAGSGGVEGLLNTCTEGAAPTTAAGQLYTREAACNSLPDARKSLWTLLTATAGQGGSKCVTVNKPTIAGNCAFIGGTSTIGGVESSAMTGSFRVAGAGAASDKVAIKKAELATGKLSVAFGTENESLIVGFNVYGGSTKLNSGLIAAKGTGNNDYSFEVGRGALKNERSITVEAVKSDGTSVRSSSVTVK